jgi:hypothetical protein
MGLSASTEGKEKKKTFGFDRLAGHRRLDAGLHRRAAVWGTEKLGEVWTFQTVATGHNLVVISVLQSLKPTSVVGRISPAIAIWALTSPSQYGCSVGRMDRRL